MNLPFSLLSFEDLHKDPEDFSQRLGKSFQETGFCGLSDHPINQELINEVTQTFHEFFSLPTNIKLEYFDPKLAGARGYTPMKVETPKGGVEADIKEFWQTGRELTKNHKFTKWMPLNKEVKEINNFKEKVNELFIQFDELGKVLLESVALNLNLKKDYFKQVADEGNSVMRSIHYPPIRSNEKGERSGAHEDINLITLLIGGHQPWLEILSKGEKWLPVEYDSNVIICNIGDMLQRFSNHRLVSTTHRVRTPLDLKNVSRYSIPFFVHPNPDWIIETLDSCVSEDNPNKYPQSIRAEDYLQQRLKEIKLV